MPSLFNPGLRLLLVELFDPIPHRAAALLIVAASVLSGCAGYQSLPEQTGAAPGAKEETGQEVVQLLTRVFQRYKGTPYRYGGTNAQGFDCSGFILTAYREGLGHRLPRTTGQMLAEGHFVRRDQLQPGDLVFFRIGGKDQHAGIFMGDDRFIHSSSSKGVMESSLANSYWRQRYTQARRFL